MERYFVLDGNQLRYYRKRGDPAPRGTYVLTDGCLVGPVFNSEDKHKHHGPVWMFRITFAVEAADKSYKKDRFLDLGAKTEADARQWRKAVEAAVRSLRELVAHQRKMRSDAEVFGSSLPPPPGLAVASSHAVSTAVKADEDTLSLFNLDADTARAEQGWWLARVTEGLRVMQESPLGPSVAAALFAQHAAASNGLLLTAAASALLSFSLAFSWVQSALVGVATAFAAVGVCVMAVAAPPSSSSSSSSGSTAGGTAKSKAAEEIPSFRVSQVVHGSPTEVFRLLMNDKRFQRWDPSIATMRVVQAMDDHADILYVTQRPTYLWPLWQKARDMVLLRYWRREEDGSFFVMYQSVDHPECRVRHNYVRANLLGGGFVIAPQRVPSGAIRSLVTYVLRYDPGGWSRLYRQLGMDVELVLPMLRSVIGIRDEMSSSDFITPMVTVLPSSTENESVGGGAGTTTTTSERGSNAGDDAAAVSVPKTFVDASGLVQGVTRLGTTSLPESMWAEPDPSLFRVRGPNYLVDKKKIPSTQSPFHLVGVDLLSFESAKDRYNLSSLPDSVASGNPNKFTFVVNLIIPGPENVGMVFYFQPLRDNWFEDGSAFSELLNDFIDGDDAFRNSRFKLIPTVVEGSFIIRQSVGSKPALLGNKLQCPYYRGDNYFEVDIDISSNSVANTVVGMVQGVTKSLVVDMAFLIEAQSEEELPETILGAVRMQHVSLDNPRRVPRNSKPHSSSVSA